MRTSAVVAALVLLGGLSLVALAADDAAGRFVMQPAEGGGFIRLDTRTGAVSLCTRRDGQWSCQAVSDAGGSAVPADVERLRTENRELRAEIARLEEMLVGGNGRSRRAERGRLELPSEEEVDKALTYLERMFRKFRDKFRDFEQQERRGTPL